MRRFELSEGTSNKFWEVDVEGTAMTVHFGRIGTSGQTQTKSFASAEKAGAERDKLVKEKVKKGYKEVGSNASVALAQAPAKPAAKPAAAAAPPAPAPAPAPAASPPPKPRATTGAVHWTDAALRAAAPIRGSDVVPPRAPDAKAIYARLRKAAQGLDKLVVAGLKYPNADREKMELARSFFADASFATPLDLDTQAAAYALFSKPVSWNDEDRGEDFVRFWVGAAGPAFAIEAFARASKLHGYAKHETHLAIVTKAVDEQEWWRARGNTAWRGLRLAAAIASEEEYPALVDLAKKLRGEIGAPAAAAIAAAFARADWCRESADVAIATPSQHGTHDWYWPLLLGMDGIDDAIALVDKAGQSAWYLASAIDSLRWDIVARFGASAQKLLVDIVRKAGVAGVERMRSIAEALALIATPDVAELFVSCLGSKELRAIAAEFLQSNPDVSLEPLAIAASQKGAAAEAARAVLRPTIAAAPELAAKLKATLTPAAQAVIASIEEHARVREEAKPEELPRVLREPPWTTKRTAAPPKVVAGLQMIVENEAVEWKPGEQEQKRGGQWLEEKPGEAKKTAEKILAAGKSKPSPTERSWNLTSASLFAHLPKKELLEVLKEIDFRRFNWSYYGVMDVLVARHGLDMLDAALRFADEIDAVAGVEAVARVNSPRVAPLMADAYVRLKKAKGAALEWLLAFPKAAAFGLVPSAVGQPGKARAAAETALRALAARGHRAEIEAAAKRYGATAAEAVREVLDFDPLFTFPTKLPKMPAFWNAGALGRPLLRGGEKALPLAALDALGTMLAFTSPDDPYPGIADVKEACDPRSLAELSWDLFQAWLVAGAPSKEQWAFLALGIFGDDECARKLTPLVRAWPGEAAHARAVVGLDVLARIGTDVALMHLHGIAQKLKFKGLQEKAREKIDQIAEARGLTAEELADRLVPDLGLDEDGSLALDFGERKFRVVFDETLKPAVTDDAGKRLPDLPKAKQTDDAEKAKEATDTWKALKKDAKTIAQGQILRLEIAMCTQRRWDEDVFRRFLLEHPLVIHLVRRLVWGVYDEKNALAATFRVAEDRSLSNAEDAPYELPTGARVGIVHRLELTDAQAAAWGQVLGDYEILQPFSQLAREIAAPTADEKNGKKLERVVGLKVPTGKVLGLDHRGWQRGAPQDGGVVCWYEKKLGGGLVACLDLDPGIFTGMVGEAPEQKLGAVTVSKGYSWRAEDNLAFGALGPIAFSELLRDLDSLRS